MSRTPSHETRFHTNVLGLIDVLYEMTSEVYQKGYEVINPTILEFVRSVIAKLDPKTVLEGFIQYSHPHWNEIRERNRNFFLTHAHQIFGELPERQVGAFKTLFSLRDEKDRYVVSEDDEACLWDYFESLVKICLKYIHDRREPQMIREDRGESRIYLKAYWSEIDLHAHAKKWEMMLEFPEK